MGRATVGVVAMTIMPVTMAIMPETGAPDDFMLLVKNSCDTASATTRAISDSRIYVIYLYISRELIIEISEIYGTRKKRMGHENR